MKKLSIILASLGLFCCSCSDFLERESLSEISNGNFWNTEEDAMKALAGCYDALQMEGNLGFCYPGGRTASLREFDYVTDNGYYAWIPWLALDVITTNTLSPTSQATSAVWTAYYAGIARCNNVIEQISQMQANGKLSEIKSVQMVNEAKFLRALYYTYLTALYRDVPWVDKTLTADNAEIPKTEKEIIVGYIVKDLEDMSKNADLLPEKTEENRGRVTQGAVLGLLCRIYLWNEMWEKAADAAQRLINLNQYTIDPEYATLFTERGNTSSEIVFSIRFKKTDQLNSEGGFLSYNYGYPMEWQLPYQNLADDFYAKDGKPIEESSVDIPNDDTTRDPRLGYTLITPNADSYAGKPSESYWGANSPFKLFQRKYQNQQTVYTDDNQDMYVIRYADVLLMRAEALAYLGKDKAVIMDMINQVRQRADVMMPKVEDAEGANLSYDELLEVIKHERRVELAFEGTRYFDLMRWKEMDKAYAKCRAEGVGGAHVFDASKGYVWPIPQSELDNNHALVQAPEWGGK